MTKILLVDDRDDNLLAIESILDDGKFQFVKANSGKKALQILLKEVDFALILMDVKMPNLSGFETAELIYQREKLRHIPIIFFTAHSPDEANMYKGYQAGAVDYIYKPVNPDLLRAKVAVFVELYRKNHQLVLQEQKLTAINKSLESEVKERKISEEKVKALNLKLLENIDKLEAANKDLDNFAFMASHDLQEPLRKIYTFSERLNSEYADSLDDTAKKYLGRVKNATVRLQALIKDIMTFSKVSQEKSAFVKSDLNILVNEVVSEMEEAVSAKHAQITVSSLPVLPINPTLMRPLFYNLIDNALKYSKQDNSPEIRIHSETSQLLEASPGGKKNRYCRIYVEDNGIGFDQVYSEQIFEMFKRLHHHNEYEGTGIGLALCKKIVEGHNGYISAKSKIGEGSTFIISLPMAN